MKFAPLHVYSSYSFLQSGLTIQKIVNATKVNDYFGVAICDKEVMYGVPNFALECEKEKKPYLIGMETKINDTFVCLYSINETGYLNLSFITSAIQKGIFTNDILLEHNEGILAIIDTHKGDISLNFKEGKLDDSFRKHLLDLNNLFKTAYLGIEISSKEDQKTATTIRNFAKEYGYDLVAFPTIRYEKENDAIILSIVNAIDNDLKIEKKQESGVQFFYKESQYEKLYTQEEIANTVKIVSSSTFNFHQKRGELIHFSSLDSKQTLKEMLFESLKTKGLENDQTYIDRLNYELDVICQMGYEDYFLVVQDYVNFAKDNDILVGPGRGSAAGSLISYLLGITAIDPIKFGLQFERFLNLDRKTMPDIDVDFMDTRRDEVVEYCRRKYGENKVANIITFQTILAKQALRDIGRIYDIPNHDIDLLSKSITDNRLSLRSAYKTLPAFKKIVDSDKYFLEIVSLASKIEGLIRQSGVHAAGVILNNDPIEKAMPISLDLSDNYISQYEMHYLEEQGFLKMDFLGLRNLSVISRCVDLVNEKHGTKILDKHNLPYDDPKVYELISSCRTMGVFQLESSGMKRAIREIKPNCFNDVVAVLALFRPGPMESIPIYAKRKEGKQIVTYISNDLEDILKDTYGIIVYQEQINQIATKMAGFTPGEADTFRRAISKKKVELLESLEKRFIDGATAKGYSYKESKNVYDHILKFANYGFNKSHSVGYALIACQMAYLKVFYPLEFYVAILENSSVASDTKFNEYVSEMKASNIKMLPPNINTSSLTFSIFEDSILFPLGAIKGINDILVNKIIEERKKKPFVDFYEFVMRMEPLGLSENQLEKLIDSGALDAFYSSRQSMRKSIKHAYQTAKLFGNTTGQMSLNLGIDQLPKMHDEPDDPLENLDKEYQALGIMLSNNPLHYKKDLLIANKVMPIIEATSSLNFKVAGIIKSKKVIHTKKGTPMAFIKLFDETGEMEIIIFPDTYSEVMQITEKNNIVLIEGRKEIRNSGANYLASSIKLLED